MLYTKKYIEKVSTVDKNVWAILFILKNIGKVSYEEIKSLIKITKMVSKEYKPEFVIRSDSQIHRNKLSEYIRAKFDNCEVTTGTLGKVWVSISWEWRYYRRNLDSDLKKLLW